jgi:hypothetical protein
MHKDVAVPQKQPLIIFAVVAGIIAFNFIGWPFGIRFIYTPLNYWAALLLSLALPLSALNVGSRFKSKALRISGVVVSLIVLMPCLAVSLFIGVEAFDVQRTNNDSSLELLHQIPVGIFKYRLYRTDCGATCSFGLNLRKEIDTPLGLKLVRSVWSKYREDAGKLALLPGKEIQVINQSGVVGSVSL